MFVDLTNQMFKAVWALKFICGTPHYWIQEFFCARFEALTAVLLKIQV